ncbi:hypothetical protein Pmar_PMAR017436 [Perkinsus marinus ATCC 50983]|uniref:Uncharacterized protein n=1 Tax=Perkinsus marinus (strain ATCC 50983 / TXsc) TaxID=423536 RepID=C5LPP3_PERM5|nr:hypothetical protein Pmar_PMAR017436 [Perkinsus marinus ATCC 50983]EER01300.1 hypothetical protein Pmar_PMAR017436 [Perkinsus marinus ATCC 50983]|eukprot:XP_002768582.1 hypothetical protein Pmar_PMAR017436 [Perkinsus marinus ATCC 50983]
MEGCSAAAARPGPKQLCRKHGGKEPQRTGQRPQFGSLGCHVYLESGQGHRGD